MTDRVPFRPLDTPRGKGPRAGGASGLSELFRAARLAARRAHAPYSGFSVGAAVQDDRGRIFRGANIENASYPLGICAERVALQIWLQQSGAPVARVAIYTDTTQATPPCGLCRDALLEWAGDAEVFLLCRAGSSGPHRAGSWLPAASS